MEKKYLLLKEFKQSKKDGVLGVGDVGQSLLCVCLIYSLYAFANLAVE